MGHPRVGDANMSCGACVILCAPRSLGKSVAVKQCFAISIILFFFKSKLHSYYSSMPRLSISTMYQYLFVTVYLGSGSDEPDLPSECTVFIVSTYRCRKQTCTQYMYSYRCHNFCLNVPAQTSCY